MYLSASRGPPLTILRLFSSRVKQKKKPKSSESKDSFLTSSPPVLYLQKYDKIIDLDELATTKRQATSPNEEDTQEKIQRVLSEAKKTKSFEKFQQSLATPLSFNYDPSSRNAEGVFSDEEVVRKNENRFTLTQDRDAKLLQWTEAKLEPSKLLSHYMMLSKFRLTALVCATSAGGFCLAPFPCQELNVGLLAISTVGVALTSASANTVNQYLEVPFDSQMNRTKNRVLVRGYLSPRHALGFAFVCGLSGTVLLATLVNPLAAWLGALNLFLYTCVYTPMKRVTIANTWVGSVVGAVPPLIGWASCTGGLEPGCLILSGLLFAWQFPHFNSLSWNLRPDYSKAGYRMMSVTDPDLCRTVALRYSIGCLAISSLAPVLDVTTWPFALESLPLNLGLIYLSWRFYQKADSSSSRTLFKYTLVHLPLLITLMFVSKKNAKRKSEAEIHSVKN